MVFVYIAEAHATDEWQLQSNLDDNVLIAQHAEIEERFAAARAGMTHLGLTMPVLIDGMDDAVSKEFAAWPERIYVAGGDGQIVFKGGPGPWEFDPDAAASALSTLLESA